MSLHIYNTAEEMTQALASWIYGLFCDRLSKSSRFSFVLSGGNTPKSLYELMAGGEYKAKIPWGRIDFFWGDERFVPFEDERNNARMAFNTLLNHVPVPADHIHRMKTEIPPEDAVNDYDSLLRKYLDLNHKKGFDLVLLGMGDDGHTLSLFPGTQIIHENKAWVGEFYLKAQEMNRITLTKVLVNQSDYVAFMATGSGKARALREVLKGKNQPDLYPSQVIHPVSGQLHWFIDKAAASSL